MQPCTCHPPQGRGARRDRIVRELNIHGERRAVLETLSLAELAERWWILQRRRHDYSD